MSRIDRRRLLTSLAGGAAVASVSYATSKAVFAAIGIGRASRTRRATEKKTFLLDDVLDWYDTREEAEAAAQAGLDRGEFCDPVVVRWRDSSKFMVVATFEATLLWSPR